MFFTGLWVFFLLLPKIVKHCMLCIHRNKSNRKKTHVHQTKIIFKVHISRSVLLLFFFLFLRASTTDFHIYVRYVMCTLFLADCYPDYVHDVGHVNTVCSCFVRVIT